MSAAPTGARPQRVQLRRSKGWRKPPGTIVVARPSRWGNPYVVGSGDVSVAGAVLGEVGHYDPSTPSAIDLALPGGMSATQAVELYRAELVEALAEDSPQGDDLRTGLAELAGHDLACWCAPGQPCHADVLLDLANPSRPVTDAPSGVHHPLPDGWEGDDPALVADVLLWVAGGINRLRDAASGEQATLLGGVDPPGSWATYGRFEGLHAAEVYVLALAADLFEQARSTP